MTTFTISRPALIVPALMLFEEMISFALDHQPAYSLDCVNYSPQEDIKVTLQGMKPFLQEDLEIFLSRGGSVLYTVD